MSKTVFLSIVTGLLSLAFLTSCEGKKHVTIPEMVADVITYEGMKSILDKHGLEIPPIYKTTPGADIRVVVIQFDINKLSASETYDEVRVTATLYERGPNSLYYTENVKFITGVPQNINREASVEEVRKVAGNFTAAASDLTKIITSVGGGISIEDSKKEGYTKFYQTTTFNTRPPSLVWTFTPFKDEELPAGTYYIFALVDVRDPTREFQIQADTSCIYRVSIMFGLFKPQLNCDPDNGQRDLVPATQNATVLPAETAPPLPAETVPPLPAETATPLPLEEILLVYGGQGQIREAVLNAVDWSSLISDLHVYPVFKDLEGEQVDVSSRVRDIEHCRQLLAEAGYPRRLHIMFWPGSETLTQTADTLGTYLAGCGFEGSLETYDSYWDAYEILRVSSMAGEAGLLLSIQAEE